MHRQRVRLDNRQGVNRLRSFVEQLNPCLVGLDPLNRLHGADDNRPTQMTPVIDALAGIAYDYSCAIVAIHHLAKPSAERRGDVWDRFRGAGAIRLGTVADLAPDGSGDRMKLVGSSATPSR
jgi:RecA-family ATPase